MLWLKIIIVAALKLHELLNQVHASHRPAHAWFLRIASIRECLYACVCVFACVSTPEAINS